MPDTRSSAAKIGVYTKYQRQKRNLSLNEFAELVGMNPSFLFRLEHGVYQTVKLDAVEKIAAGLDMNVADFLAKCQIGRHYAAELPPLEFYLKELYQFPPAAIEDVQLFIRFLQEKYQQDIADRKAQHLQFWSKKKRKRSK